MSNYHALYDPTAMICLVDGERIEAFACDEKPMITHYENFVQVHLQATSKSAKYLIGKMHQEVELIIQHGLFCSKEEIRSQYLDVVDRYTITSYCADMWADKIATITFSFEKDII